MSQKASPTVIGAFVILGLALAVAGIVAIGSGRWFDERTLAIAYFDTSVQGLNAGSPVKLRGVAIGQVKEVLIHHNQAPHDRAIPVLLEINETVLARKVDDWPHRGEGRGYEGMIERGLRAILAMESLVTGQLYVELDVVPNAAPPVLHQVQRVHLELPTMPSQTQRLLDNLASLDLKGLTDRMGQVLERVDATLGQLRVQDISRSLTNLLASLNQFVTHPDLTNSLTSLRQALADTRALLARIEARVGPLADAAETTLTDARDTLVEFRGAAQDVRQIAAPQGPLRHDLRAALDEIRQAAQAIAALAELLERNPNAVLTGRQPPRPAPANKP